VLIGHSFGGLVLKSLVVKLKTMQNHTNDWSKATYKCAEGFLSNVRGWPSMLLHILDQANLLNM
jgi:hypothetical protein